MARRTLAPEEREPAIIRLQLELKLDRHSAEAVVRAGFLTASQIAASADEEFHGAVRLPLKRRAEVLALAREPGAHGLEAGPAPASMSSQPRRGVLVRAVAPVRKTVSKMLDGKSKAPPKAAKGALPAPPHADPEHARKRARKRAGEDVEAAVDEELSNEA